MLLQAQIDGAPGGQGPGEVLRAAGRGHLQPVPGEVQRKERVVQVRHLHLEKAPVRVVGHGAGRVRRRVRDHRAEAGLAERGRGAAHPEVRLRPARLLHAEVHAHLHLPRREPHHQRDPLVRARLPVDAVEGLAVGDPLLRPLPDGVAALDAQRLQRAAVGDAGHVRLLVHELQLHAQVLCRQVLPQLPHLHFDVAVLRRVGVLIHERPQRAVLELPGQHPPKPPDVRLQGRQRHDLQPVRRRDGRERARALRVPGEGVRAAPSCSCFVFAHPPDCAAEHIPRDASAALRGFFANGGYLYFNYGARDVGRDDAGPDRCRDPAPPVACAVAFVPGTVAQCAGVPHVFPVELQQNFQDAAEALRLQERLDMGVRILQNLREYQAVVPDSLWAGSVNAAAAPDGMVWMPPFSFGEEDESRYGGFAFRFTDRASGVTRSTFYRFKGTVDMFRPRTSCLTLATRNEARRATDVMLEGLKSWDPTFSLQTKSGQAWSLANEVPYQLRAATALLAALGRRADRAEEVISGRGHYEYCASEVQPPGIFNVVLDMNQSREPKALASGDLRLNAYTMTDALREYLGRDEFESHVATIGWLFQPKKAGGRWSDLPQVNRGCHKDAQPFFFFFY